VVKACKNVGKTSDHWNKKVFLLAVQSQAVSVPYLNNKEGYGSWKVAYYFNNSNNCLGFFLGFLPSHLRFLFCFFLDQITTNIVQDMHDFVKVNGNSAVSVGTAVQPSAALPS